ncbi:MAG: class I SAM-dependent methyltransferase [Promethearchaeota archaeon]
MEKKIRSAWKEHHYLFLWLVRELKPMIIVDLGVDKVFSSFIFASQKMGRVIGIDSFMRENLKKKKIEDSNPCVRNKKIMEKKFGIHNVTFIKGMFSDVVKKWKIPIDILYIDGTYTYDGVKEDYQNWSKFLKQEKPKSKIFFLLMKVMLYQ